jgi:cysteine-rich repeat protein
MCCRGSFFLAVRLCLTGVLTLASFIFPGRLYAENTFFDDTGTTIASPTPTATPSPEPSPTPSFIPLTSFVCGNGLVEQNPACSICYGNETCDDGNRSDGDGCSSRCQIEYGWNCGTPSGDGASVCTRSVVCGDLTISGAEECDDGDTESGDGCDESCQVEEGWECSDTATQDPWPLSGPNPNPWKFCHEVCGDGITVGRELGGYLYCEDGNTRSGDGCSSDCRIEQGARCGDGIRIEELEECDDGNMLSNDGCSSTCEVEEGWECVSTDGWQSSIDGPVPDTVCSPICGDRLLVGREPFAPYCDDGNEVSGDGCSSSCTREVCCICEYQDFPECAAQSEDTCEDTVTSNGKKDCDWIDDRCQSRFQKGCEDWAVNDQQTEICQAGPEIFPLTNTGQSTTAAEEFLSGCYNSVQYQYNGHGNCDVPDARFELCLTCLRGSCREISIQLNSCSSFPSEEEKNAFIARVQAALQPGDVVHISGEQNWGFSIGGLSGYLFGEPIGHCESYENPISMVITKWEVITEFALCSELGTPSFSICGPIGSTSYCIDDDTQQLSELICCPLGDPSTGGQYRQQCSGYTREVYTCSSTHSYTQLDRNAIAAGWAYNQLVEQIREELLQCLHREYWECRNANGYSDAYPTKTSVETAEIIDDGLSLSAQWRLGCLFPNSDDAESL